jgi:transposase, IS30 family
MSYAQLTLHERYVIYHLKLCRLSLREIARRLNRHHTTISRELQRNGPEFSSWVYWHEGAHQKAMARRQLPRHFRRHGHVPLLNHVKDRLREDWSPETIVARLCMDYSEDQSMRVSAETIYRWIYRDASAGGSLFTCLCRLHKKRRKQRRYGAGRGLIPGRISIDERPECVATRERYGDWEGDTVEGARGSGYITTHVDRKSRYLIAGKLTNKSAAVTAQAVITAYRRIPGKMRATLTLDNGKEFARFKEIEQRTGLTVYFADPYASWQRGTNENTNGLLRRYFPKGSDFREVTQETLAAAVKKLNHRPRKCLGYRTPHEVFQEARRGALAM